MPGETVAFGCEKLAPLFIAKEFFVTELGTKLQ